MTTTYFRRNDDGTFDQQCGIHGWQPILDLQELFGLDEMAAREQAVGWWQGGVSVAVTAIVLLGMWGVTR